MNARSAKCMECTKCTKHTKITRFVTLPLAAAAISVPLTPGLPIAGLPIADWPTANAQTTGPPFRAGSLESAAKVPAISPATATSPGAEAAVKPRLLDSLQDLSKRFKVAFVVEGSPEDFFGEGQAAAALPSADLAKEDLTACLNSLCAAYDLSWQPEGREGHAGTTCVLLRNYTSLKSLPGLTLPEVNSVAQDMSDLLEPYEGGIAVNGSLSQNPIFASFYSSLSAEQVDRMKTAAPDYSRFASIPGASNLRAKFGDSAINLRLPADKVLPLSELLPDQQATLRRIVQHLYLGEAIKNTQAAAREIESVARDGADFCWRDLHGVRSFGFEIALRDETGTPIFIPLSDPNRVSRTNNGIIISKAALLAGTDAPPASPVTPPRTLPTLPTLPAVPAVPAVPAAVTVKSDKPDPDTLQFVATRAAQKESKSILLEKELWEKPAVLIGEEHAASNAELRALSRAYGLRLLAVQGRDEQVMSRYPVVRPSGISGLHEAILAAVPAPFMRALTSGAAKTPLVKSEQQQLPNQENQEEQAPNAQDRAFAPAALAPAALAPAALAPAALAPANVAHSTFGNRTSPSAPEKAFAGRLTAIRSAAAQKLRGTLEAKVAASRSGKVALREVSRQERMALADVLMADYLSSLRTVFSAPVPASIANFDRAAVNCRAVLSQGQPFFVFAFYTPVASVASVASVAEGQQYQGGLALSVRDRSATPAPRTPLAPQTPQAADPD